MGMRAKPEKKRKKKRQNENIAPECMLVDMVVQHQSAPNQANVP